MECIYKIYACNFQPLQDKINKLNKKAKKLNCELFKLDIIETCTIKEDEYADKIHFVTLSGKPPIINNWAFIGTIEHHEKGNIVKIIPGNEFPEHYKTVNSICEHCNTNRRRNDTYLVKNTITGEFKQVGKSCLKDFTGHTNPQGYAEFMEWLADSSWLEKFESIPEKNYHDRNIDLYEYLSHVAYHIRNDGWTSKTIAREYEKLATCDQAINGMFPMKTEYQVSPEDQDVEMAKTAIQWAKQVDYSKNDYLYNISIIAHDEFTSFKNKGFAASIVSSYIKSLETEQERIQREKEKQERAKQKAESSYYGNIGDKIQLSLIYVNSFCWDSEYGTQWLHKFIDENNNTFVWKTNKSMGVWDEEGYKETEQGTELKLKGTIKEHKEFKNEKQTVLTRCKIL